MIDVRAQFDLVFSAPFRRRERYVHEPLKATGSHLRSLKKAASRRSGNELKRIIAMRPDGGSESACRQSGLNHESIGAKNLILQREEIDVLFQLGRGPKGCDA